MNKKGAIGIISIFIVATVSVLLLANVLFPQVFSTTRAQDFSETFSYVRNNVSNTSVSLTYDDLATLSITGLTLSTNYTQDLSAGTINILANTTATDTYTATYTYYADNYLTNTGQRSLMAVMILAGIIGLLYWLLRALGVV